jgi:uncharacterized protein
MSEIDESDHPAVAASAPAVSCPTCGTRVAWRANSQRPFCSLTCRLIDLGLWLDGRYRIESDDLGPDDRPNA